MWSKTYLKCLCFWQNYLNVEISGSYVKENRWYNNEVTNKSGEGAIIRSTWLYKKAAHGTVTNTYVNHGKIWKKKKLKTRNRTEHISEILIYFWQTLVSLRKTSRRNATSPFCTIVVQSYSSQKCLFQVEAMFEPLLSCLSLQENISYWIV